MTVKAKFYVSEVAMYPGQDGGHVTLQPSTRGAINAEWAAATPSGKIEMHINNAAAFKHFADAVADSAAPEFVITFERTTEADYPHFFVPFTMPDHWQDGRCSVCGDDEEAELHDRSAASSA